MAHACAHYPSDPNTLPGRQGGKGLVANLVIIALLALAVFFYVRAVVPPAQEDSAASGPQQAAVSAPPEASAPVPAPGAAPGAAPAAASVQTAPIAPVPEALTSVYGAAPKREGAPGLDPKLVDALQSVMPRAAGGTATPAATPPAQGAAVSPDASPPTPAAAPPPASAPADAQLPAGGPIAVPSRQIDLIREVFAPELLPAASRP